MKYWYIFLDLGCTANGWCTFRRYWSYAAERALGSTLSNLCSVERVQEQELRHADGEGPKAQKVRGGLNVWTTC